MASLLTVQCSGKLYGASRSSPRTEMSSSTKSRIKFERNATCRYSDWIINWYIRWRWTNTIWFASSMNVLSSMKAKVCQWSSMINFMPTVESSLRSEKERFIRSCIPSWINWKIKPPGIKLTRPSIIFAESKGLNWRIWWIEWKRILMDAC